MSPALMNAYRTAEISTLSQRDLIIKLYQGSIRFLNSAIDAAKHRHPEDVHNNCVRAKKIFIELASTLKFDQGGDIAKRLYELYIFFIMRITEANLRKDPTLIEELIPLIQSLVEAWEQVPLHLADTTSMPVNDGHSFSLRT
jgi:flagellar protein FliS